MKHPIFLTLACAAALVAAAGTPVHAQDSRDTKSPAAKDSSSAPKKHGVWTDDEVSTLRTPEDNYLEQKQAAEAAAPAAAAAAAAEQAKSKTKSGKAVGGPSRLTNPKSPDDADRMIAWENRDVDAQQEFVDNLRAQIQEAKPEDRDQLEKTLAKRIQIVEETKKERDALVAQKKGLEKKLVSAAKPVDSASTSTSQ